MKIGLFLGSFAGGGAERMMVNLAKGLSNNGIEVIMYVVNKTGPYLKEVPKNISIKSYESKYGVKFIIHKIRKTLKYDGLNAFISTQIHINSAVALASIGLKNRPNLIFREANTPSQIITSRFVGLFYRWCYLYADHYVAVSQGVKKDMIEYFNINKEKISVIYNPVIDDSIYEKMNEELDHPWFIDSEVPVIVGMGRFEPQKAFEDLVDAFVLVRKKMKARLVIFGKKNKNSAYFQMIQKKIDESGFSEDISLPGFVDNPFKYLKNANLFVLSSKFEGLPGVLIQAMVCGCPVVSTNCPSGPSEILKNGKYGELVDVGDYRGMAKSIISLLYKPHNVNKVKERASYFSIDDATENYLKLTERIERERKINSV